MPTGRLKKWFEEKGFGFIAPDDATSDMFASRTGFRGANEADIKEGARVQFEAELEVRTNKMKASTWAVVDGNAADPAAALAGLAGLGGFGAAGLGGIAGLGALGAAGLGGLGAAGLAGYGAIPGFSTSQLGAIPGLSPYGVAGLGAVGGLSLLQAAPAVTAAPAALPPGWEQVTDPNTNRPYWCNRSTGESSWTPPAAAAAHAGAVPGLDPAALAAATAATAPAAVADGSVGLDPAAAAAAGAAAAAALTGVAPGADAIAAAGMVAAAPAAAGFAQAAAPAPVAAAAPAGAALPAGWEQATDPNTNRVYYFNRATGQTSWTIPAA